MPKLPRFLLLLSISLLAATASFAAPGAAPANLRCEYLANPLGIDVAQPRLSWALPAASDTERGLRQTAFQVLVADSIEALGRDEGNLWDSGEVSADTSIHVPYPGAALQAQQQCFWKVRYWNQDGQASDWSAPASWSMGLLAPEGAAAPSPSGAPGWKAQWLGYSDEDQVSPLFRTAFNVAQPVKRATLYVTGVGFHEVYLNGAKVGDHEMDPGFTRYDRRVLYVTHDVTGQVKQGENAVGVMLGNGWYNYPIKAAWDFNTAPWRDKPRMLLQMVLELADGSTQTIVSDDTWKAATSPTIYNALLNGETYDARLERTGWDAPGYNDSGWDSARLVDAPKGVLSALMAPPVKVMARIRPVKLTEPKPGVFVYDLGQNLAGVTELTVSGDAGTTVQMLHGEVLNPDGTLNMEDIARHTYEGDFQTDRYILKGQGTEVWRPRFGYHGFRYIQVTGYPGTPTLDSVCGLMMHAAFDSAGDFACSNDLLNRIQANTRWSYISNFFSIPTDCPHREKNGWMGDAHLAAETGLFNYSGAANYTKWLQDIQDEQSPDGQLPGIVPTGGWGYKWGNGPAWDSAYTLIPWYLYVYCGDQRILERHYDNLKRYVDYIENRSKDHIADFGLGDWCPADTKTPAGLTSTGYQYRNAVLLSDVAKLLGKQADADHYAALAKAIGESFTEKYYKPETAQYDEGSQTALSCALYQGLAAPEDRARIAANLLKNVEDHNNHLDCGILGTKYLLHALSDNGYPDTAYKVITQTDFPSWGHWLEQGATGLWEQWGTKPQSRNHIMFGDISAWCFENLAGINPDPASPGFKHIVFRPTPVSGLTWAKAHHDTLYGRIDSSWKRDGNTLTWQGTVPPNTSATLYLPVADAEAVLENGHPAAEAPGAQFVRMENGRAVYTLQSGSYTFTATTS